jgi:microcystin-dependent protein
MALNKRLHAHGFLIDQEIDRLDQNIDRVASCSGMVEWFAGDKDRIPKTYHPLDGRVISRQQNPRLFHFFREGHGGDGETTFGLPDWTGAIPRGAPQIGPVGGSTTHTIGTGASSLTTIDVTPCVRAG